MKRPAMLKFKKDEKSLPVLHPNAQVIITGIPISPAQAQEVMDFAKQLSFDGWCDQNGSIGHFDSIKPNTQYKNLLQELQELALRFNFLDLGVSLMNGPPGSYNSPVASFRVSGSSVKKSEFPHLTHPAPKRLKPRAS